MTVRFKKIRERGMAALDEINLAPTEVLDRIATTLDVDNDNTHPEFRLFACMNPPTDAGKKALPQSYSLGLPKFT